MNEYAAALDFGSSKIALAVGEKCENGIRIISYNDVRTDGIDKGEIVKDKQTVDAIRELVRKAEEQTGKHIGKVSVSLSGKALFSKTEFNSRIRSNPDEYISTDELAGMAESLYKSRMDEGMTVFEVIPQSYNVDEYQGLDHKDLIGRKGSTVEARYNLVYGKSSILERRKAILSECGLSIDKAILAPVAAARAVFKGPEKENGAVLVDMGKGTTEIAVVKDDVVRMVSSIPFAGESITRDIKTVANVTAKWAEEAKVLHGCSCADFTPENKKLILRNADGVKEGEIELALLSEITEARLSEIFEAIRYLIDNSGYGDALPSGIVLTGGTAYMEFIQQLGQAITGRSIRLASPSGSITSDSDEKAFDAYSSVAVGLVIETLSPEMSYAISNATATAPVRPVSPRPVGGIFDNNEGEPQWAEDEEMRKDERARKEEEKRRRKEEEKRRKEEERKRKEEEKKRKEQERNSNNNDNKNGKDGKEGGFFGSLFGDIFSGNNEA
ncbi:MAG: cell division protein FtsA [Bacteroidales bacterium]|nr:cell division protein FtsA [Candidatus Cacconaster merdequi]